MYFWPMETLTHSPALARFGYAVTDPTRARTLLVLAEAPAYPSDLADSLGVSRQSMSNHLPPSSPGTRTRLTALRCVPARRSAQLRFRNQRTWAKVPAGRLPDHARSD